MFSLFLSVLFLCGATSNEIMASEQKEIYSWRPGSNEVQIAYSGVKMPLDRILLFRKGIDYCAIIFTHFSGQNERGDISASYECFYPDDKSESFPSKSLQIKKGNVKSKLRGFGECPLNLVIHILNVEL